LNIIEIIQSKYATLSNTQKKIGDLIIQNPQKVCFLSLNQFSIEVNVTETTIINFTKKIGLKNFIELKREIQAYVEKLVSPPDKILNALKNENGIEGDYKNIIESDLEGVRRTVENIKVEDLKQAVHLLKNSTKVYLIGVGISEVVVTFLMLRIKLLGFDTEIFEVSTYNVLSLQLLKIKPTDVFIVVSFPQYSKLAAMTVDYLNTIDCKMISITKSASSPLAKHSDVIFICYNDSVIFYNSMTAPIAVANILVSSLAVEMRDKLVDNIEKMKEIEDLFLKEEFYKE
jgi:DNA-binding MurR/RpiR family transcriptional regulator